MGLTKTQSGGLADDSVNDDKLANSIVSAIAANTAKDLTALSASNLTSGTVPDARFPATLPAKSAANLTNIPAANITGTLPAISATNLTNIPAANITGALPAISGANLTDIDAGATGTGNDKIFWENGQTVTQSYTVGTTFGAACNAMSAGPITINNNVVVTVGSGNTWTIV